MREFVFAVTAVLLSNAALADLVGDPVTSSLPRIVTSADAGKPITLKVGQCIDVRLSTQAASTGYDWYLAPGMPEIMGLSARTVTTPGGAPPGAPSQLDYILCAEATGDVTVKFLNYRVWEKNTLPAKELTFPVTITP